MDCGPAALKCLLEGFGMHASYGRLREACQTDVDGTSIDTLEDVANDVGLDRRAEILPVDHVLVPARGRAARDRRRAAARRRRCTSSSPGGGTDRSCR